jgi:VanZ family protein
VSRSRLPFSLWLLSAAFIVYGTMIPFRFVTDRDIVLAHLARVTLNPLISPDTGGRLSTPDVVSNVVLFVPFGCFGVWAWPRARSVLARVIVLTVLAALLSVTVETMQLFTLDRTSSIADVVANTAGAFGGAVLGTLLRTSVETSLAAMNANGLATAPTLYPLLIATLLLCAAVLEPFDVTLDVGSVVAKAKTLLHDPWQGGPLTDEGLSILQHGLFACTLVVWFEEVRFETPVVLAALVATVASIGLELSQLFIGARMPGGRDAIVGVIGSLCGIAVSFALPAVNRRWLWCAGVFLLTTIGVALQQLSPFSFGAQSHPFQWVPFLNYYDFTTSETVSHSAELLMSYFPLGFAIALTIRRRQFRLPAVILAGLLIAAPIEYLQGFIGSRYPDVTDIGLSVVGAWLGSWAATEGWRLFDAELALTSQ